MNSEELWRPESYSRPRACVSQPMRHHPSRRQSFWDASLAGRPWVRVSDTSNVGSINSLAAFELLDNTRETEGIRLPVCFFAVGDSYKPSKESDQEGGVPCASG